MGKKLTYEYVKEQIEKVPGYYLVSKEYIDSRTNLEILCTNCEEDHIFEKSYNAFQQGHVKKKIFNF